MGPVYPQIRTSADILKSTIRIEQLIPFLKEQKAEVGALVNSKLYGLLPFVTAMKKANIQPVIGLIIEVEFEGANRLPVILYAKTNDGYRNLLKVSSAAALVRKVVLENKDNADNYDINIERTLQEAVHEIRQR